MCLFFRNSICNFDLQNSSLLFGESVYNPNLNNYVLNVLMPIREYLVPFLHVSQFTYFSFTRVCPPSHAIIELIVC